VNAIRRQLVAGGVTVMVWTALLQMIASATTNLAHLNEDDAGAGSVHTITVTRCRYLVSCADLA
jgi:hypothetical protein